MRRRLVILGLPIILVFLVVVFASIPNTSLPAFLNPLHQAFLPITTPKPTPDPLRPVNLLLLGYAGKNHDGGNLSDTIMIININPKNQIATLISLPRDLWVNLPISPEATPSYKINAAWAIGNDDKNFSHKPALFSGPQGGFNLAKYAVTQATGIKPDYVLAVDFTGFKNLINLAGPLTVTVPYTFDDYYYPITGEEQNPCGKSPEDIAALSATMSGEKLEREFPCRFEHLHFTKGEQIMDADTALKFVRSRHAENGGGDFGRLTRQQAVITALKKQLLNPAIIPKLGSLIETGFKSIKTDLDLAFIQAALKNYPDPHNFTIHSLTINQKEVIKDAVSPDRQYILIPVLGEGNFSAIHQLIQSTLNSTASAILTTPAP